MLYVFTFGTRAEIGVTKNLDNKLGLSCTKLRSACLLSLLVLIMEGFKQNKKHKLGVLAQPPLRWPKLGIFKISEILCW